jgi:hypothetical protein
MATGEILITQYAQVKNGEQAGAAGMAGKREGVHSAKRDEVSEELGATLRARYRTTLIEKLTRKDLEALKFYLRRQFDEHGHLNNEYKGKFEWTLRKYLNDEVLTREITGIEALVRILQPEELKS